jgi:hypothetical protein
MGTLLFVVFVRIAGDTLATRHPLVLDNLAIKVVLGLDNAAQEDPAAVTGARPVLSRRDERIARCELRMPDRALRSSDGERQDMHARAAPIKVIRAGTSLALPILDIEAPLPVLARHAVVAPDRCFISSPWAL